MDLDGLVDLALRASRAGAEVHRAGLRERQTVTEKSSPTDVVTEVDHAAERAIVDTIRRDRPDDGILGEEGTERTGTSGVRWVIDPLDGTTNYVYRFPAFAVSIGIEIDGVATIGVVQDTATERVYLGVRGRGATCNGSPIRASDKMDLPTALVATGFQPHPTTRADQAAVLARILPRVRDVRRAGSAAIDLSSVACGRLDAFYERGLAPWDVSAGLVIAEAAGARTARIDLPALSPLVLAAAPAIFDPLLDLLREAGACG